MTPHTIGLPVALGFFIAFVLALPLIRHYRRTGRLAIVIRNGGSSLESFVRVWFVGLLLAVGAWTILVPALGTARLGAWTMQPWLAWLGLGAIGVGIVLAVIAQANMGTSWRIGIDDAPTELVTGGVFRFVRHPIYTGILLMLAGIACLTPSPWTVCAGIIGYVIVAVQSRLEEDHMVGQHGTTYAAWAARTGRFIPFVGRWHGAAEVA